MTDYEITLKKLHSMDENQFLDLFHDLENRELVQMIAETSSHYLETVNNEDIQDCDFLYLHEGESDEVDWKQQDDAMRYRDSK